jgi:Protein of unknown function (DUF2569)
MAITVGDQVVQSMRQKNTEELLEIWKVNDRGQWSDAAFNAIVQVLSERGVSVSPQISFVPSSPGSIALPPHFKGVRGWLLFFCLQLTVFNPLAAIPQILAPFTAEITRTYPLRQLALQSIALLYIAFAAFSLYAGVRLWRIVPGAVKTANWFLWYGLVAMLISTALLFIAGLLVSPWIVPALFGSVIYYLIWLSYLGSSKRVMATYDSAR